MSARVTMTDDALATIDGERRAKRTIRCIEHCMALSRDVLLHEVQDALAADGVSLRATPRLRGFLRTVARKIEGAE
jgi:hypothetical protein